MANQFLRMLPIILCDSAERHENLLPLSFTRSIADFRVGILTIAEKWDALSDSKVEILAPDYLVPKYPRPAAGVARRVASHIVPDGSLVEAVMALAPGQKLVADGEVLAVCGTQDDYDNRCGQEVEYPGRVNRIMYVFDLFRLNGEALRDDYMRITAGRKSQPLSPSNTLIGSPVDEEGRPTLFIEEGASVEGAFINVTNGPIYIGKDAEVMEGSCLRGPLAVCDNAHINMGAKIYGDTTIGPWCKAGGEVNNVVMFAYSNKSHDGFLGNAVIGEWCNIGAGVNASNLKNDYSKIRIWNYATRSFMRTDLQFCGLIMGDHSKIGINVMLNTATVIGVGVNLHGAGFPRTFIPSFSEGSPAAGFTEVVARKFNETARCVMSRRGLDLTEADLSILDAVRSIASTVRR